MKTLKKILAVALVVMSMLALAATALAEAGTVDTTYGSTPGGTVRYYSNYSTSTSTSGLTNVSTLANGSSLDVQIQNAHWYKFTKNGSTYYVQRRFVRVRFRESEVRYGTMELNLGCSYTNYVKNLQQDLNTLGYNAGAVDGKFGSGTRTALINFQTEYDISADGRCGPVTRQTLYNAVTY